MTDSPDVPPLAAADAREAIAALRESGLRLSTARRLVIEALFAADGPVSAAYLSAELRIDESSVYRNLELLERHGLVRHLHLGHGPGLYVLRARTETEYLYCQSCARVTCVSPAELDPVREEIRVLFGYEVHFGHFAIVGVCAQCAGRATSEAPRPGDAHSHGDYVHAHRAAGEGHTHRR